MAIEQRMSVERTRAIIKPFVESEDDDVSALAPDVVFRMIPTGQEYRTPEGVQAMLNNLYNVAFDATTETKNLIVSEGVAVQEAVFVGRHIGEFGGVAATGRNVRVPFAVIYDLRDDKIVEGRVYFESAFLAEVQARH